MAIAFFVTIALAILVLAVAAVRTKQDVYIVVAATLTAPLLGKAVELILGPR